jgi:hypothetical protein
VLAQADTPTEAVRPEGHQRDSVALATPNRSAPNAATSVAKSQRVLHRRSIEHQIKAHACKSAEIRASHGLRMDGGYEPSATSDSLAQPLSTSASREVHAAALERELPVFATRFGDCGTAVPRVTRYDSDDRNRSYSMRLATIPMIGIANNPCYSLRFPLSESSAAVVEGLSMLPS